MKRQTNDNINRANLIVYSVFVSFVSLLLFKTLFYLDYISNLPMVLDFLIPLIIIIIICYFMLNNLSKYLIKIYLGLKISSIFGLFLSIALIVLPNYIKLDQNIWILIIGLGIIIGFLLMTIIAIIVTLYVQKNLDTKKLSIIGRVSIFYLVLFIIIILSSILWGIIFNPII